MKYNVIGARITGVDEPVFILGSGLFRSQSILQVAFEKITEPKSLSVTELRKVVKKYGTYAKSVAAIGTSEAFVRQNSNVKAPSSCKRSFPAF